MNALEKIPSQALVILAIFTAHGRATETLELFHNKAIIDGSVGYKQTVERRCECREACWQDANCTGVSIAAHASPRLHVCSFSQQPLDNTTATLTSNTAANTFIKKKKPVCPANYTDVPKVGCLFISTQSLTYAAAKTACPAGSAGLFAAHTVDQFSELSLYMNKNKETMKTDYWIGIERDPGTDIWRWRHGSYIGITQPSYFWGLGDPNDGTNCARLAYYPLREIYYMLADVKCTTLYNFICEL
ncbi:uncharacterized protein LOC125178268 [Hyalella azteca]|uniref:Uncharacterized protein LOC125178268 n=1 Tax=Hyalella azteca TaxID=294128 RepID=A0A979FLP6_HYAAZ|nr:uncharacterized protein LOC125178268 [Hyalella azteca]